MKGSKEFLFLILTCLLFFILRLPSLFEPLWYGDEGIYQVIGTSLNHGKLLYKEIFDNKPPLLYWLYSFFHSDQFTIRLASLIFGMLAVLFFFLLSKKLFKNRNDIQYLTTFIFAVLFGLPILEGNIANAENFMILPILVAALLVSNFKLFLAGLFLGVAFLFKIVAIFDFSAFFVFYFILNFSSLKKEIKLSRIFAGFLLPIFFTILFFALKGALPDFIRATFITNVSYVNYGNKIGSLPLLLFVKLALLGLFTMYLFTKRKKFSQTLLFVLIWFGFSLFNAFFSERPYIHYLLVLLPSLSLLVGCILFEKKYQKIIIVFLIMVLIVLSKSFGIPGLSKNISYYQNFTSYMSGARSMDSYQAFFDLSTPFDYEIARFIRPKINKNETIFVWGNNAQLYQLVGVIAPTKYIVAYHITDYKDGGASTKNAIDKIKPKFIVVMPNQQIIPFSLIHYSERIKINNAIIYERLF